MKYTHDIIVIGAGSGGLNIAGFMNKAGFSVLLIDKSDSHIGGDCLNFGCVPSKALIHIAHIAKTAKQATELGLKVSGTTNMKKVVHYVKSKQDVIRVHENAAYFRSKGMDVQLGEAKFTGKNSISLNGKTYSAKRIVLATGSRPRQLQVPGVEKIKYYTNEQIFDLDKLPKNFVVIGGGPIGMEISQAFCRLGSQVTILEHGSKFLPKENSVVAAVLQKQLEKEGVHIIFNTEIKGFPAEKKIEFTTNGKKQVLGFDALFVGIGRQLNHENLNLEKAGIKLTENGRGLIVNDRLQTTNKNVYVCGDIAGSYQFTHAAELHAGVILQNFFSPFKKKLSNDKLSWVTYTDPQIATFGLNEQELQKRKIKYEKLSTTFEEDDRAIVDEYEDSYVEIYISKNKIVGGSMVAPHAGELFQELVLAMSAELDIKHIFNKVYAYPTATRINKRIIANHFSSKLTDRAKRILKTLY